MIMFVRLSIGNIGIIKTTIDDFNGAHVDIKPSETDTGVKSIKRYTVHG